MPYTNGVPADGANHEHPHQEEFVEIDKEAIEQMDHESVRHFIGELFFLAFAFRSL